MAPSTGEAMAAQAVMVTSILAVTLSTASRENIKHLKAKDNWFCLVLLEGREAYIHLKT